MIAVDTNILVHAHRNDSPWHSAASGCVRFLAEGRQHWAIPWPCVHEFLSVCTNPKIMQPVTPPPVAMGQVEAWMKSPTLTLLAEGAGHWAALKSLADTGRIVGAKFHDARIAALCLQHGIAELWTADRDFSRFPTLKTRNPLVE